MLAWLRRISFDEAYGKLERLRAIDRQGELSRKGGEAIFARCVPSELNLRFGH